MQIQSFPACCTALVLSHFSGSAVSVNAYQPATSTEELIDYMLQNIIHYPSHAVITATTNNQQVYINSGLELMGFQSTPWLEKGAHPETQIKLWWLPIRDITPAVMEEWRVLLSNMGYERPVLRQPVSEPEARYNAYDLTWGTTR